MKKLSLLFLSLITICLTYPLKAQRVVEWQRTLGGSGLDWCNSVQSTSDGGYIVGGYSYSDSSGIKTEGRMGDNDYWIFKLDAGGNTEWQNTIGGDHEDVLSVIRQTTDGGYILGGYSDSDSSGDKTLHTWGYYNHDYWVVKLDGAGNIKWQKVIGGTSYDLLTSLELTTDGGYILGGYTASGISGNKTEDSKGWDDYWIVKIDSLGNIQWQKEVGGNYWDRLQSIKQTADGGYILGGYSNSHISGDKTEDLIGNMGLLDYWVVKLDASGNVQWDNTIGGDYDDELFSVEQTSDGNYILGGWSQSDNSGDKTENWTGDVGDVDYWIIKLDTAGNILWQNSIGGESGDYLRSLQQTTDGGYILGGSSSSWISGDKTEDQGGYWIVRVDSSGNKQWDEAIGGNIGETLYSIQQTNDGGYILGGHSLSGIGGDKTDSCFGEVDYWIVKLRDEYNQVTGKVFYDVNSNLVQDSGEIDIPDYTISDLTDGRFAFTQFNGEYTLAVLDTGSFVVSPSQTLNYYSAVPAADTVHFSANNQIDSLHNFAFQPSGAFDDLGLVLTPLGSFRPGFDALYSMKFTNVGTTSLQGTVVFYPDANLSYVSSPVTPNLITTDSVVWNISSISPWQSGNILVIVKVSANAMVNSTIHSLARISISGTDADTSNNHASWDVFVSGSWDPNDILVDKETLNINELSNPPFLEYVINFQNTGNDTAFNIKVFDRMPLTLDISSFQFVASSAPVTLHFNSFANEMEFHFDNILLPDSNMNESGSHGFIRYKIKPVTTLGAGDTIINNASIFFDFNAPVITNDALTQIILATTTDEPPFAFSGLRLYPNPATHIVTIETRKSFTGKIQWSAYDVFGREVFDMQTENKNEISFNVSEWTEGIYFISAQSDDGIYSGRMLKE